MSVAQGIQRALQLYSVINNQRMQQARYAQAERRLELEEEFRRADMDYKRMTQTRQQKTADARQKRDEVAEEMKAFDKGYVPLDEAQARGETSIDLGPGLATTEQGRSFKTASGRVFYPQTTDEKLRIEAQRLETLQPLKGSPRMFQFTNDKGEAVIVEATPGQEPIERSIQAKGKSKTEPSPRMFQVTGDRGETTIVEAPPGQQPIERPLQARGKSKTPPKPAKPTAEDRKAKVAEQIEEAARQVIEDTKRGGGDPLFDAARNAQKYYEKDPVIRLHRAKVVKRVEELVTASKEEESTSKPPEPGVIDKAKQLVGLGPAKKKATKADVTRFSKAKGITYDQALAEFKKSGWEVQ